MLSLMREKEKPSLNIFIDKTYSSAIIISILDELLTIGEDVILLAYHNSETTYREKLKDNWSKITFYDGFNDPFHWFDESSRVNSSVEGSHDNLKFLINKLKGSSSSQNSVIFIDDILIFGRSLSCIDDFGNWNGLISLLQDMCADSQLYGFVNPDLMSEGNHRSLLYISNFYVTVTVTPKVKHSYHCESILRKKSGKILNKTITVHKDGKGRLCISNTTKEESDQLCKEEVDPASNLTFNLRLTDSEKKARANTTLPYLLNQSSKSVYLENSVRTNDGGGDVIYMPDEADDFDDEDPDDDLDV